MNIVATSAIALGLLLLVGSGYSFVSRFKKLRHFTKALAIVDELFYHETKDEQGETVSAGHVNKITIYDRSGEYLNTLRVDGSRKVGTRYIICYDPATGPTRFEKMLVLSLSTTWSGPLTALFLGVFLISTGILFYLFH
ncbi:MAG TPA: hypothetical protein VFN35_21670 [Ktedonobacteraceae bacterium]|nr:hypothetical protein [Ktedonobacteraceae bacterium]